MTPQERHIDIQNLKKHREFYALKVELESFCEKMESNRDIELKDVQRLEFSVECASRAIAAKEMRNLLSTLGLVDKTKPKLIDKTME